MANFLLFSESIKKIDLTSTKNLRTKKIQYLHMIKIITNRANRIFYNARKEFIKNNIEINKNTIVYLDSYENKLCDIQENSDTVMLIDQKHTRYISNKRICSDRFRNMKLFQHYPKTYNQIDDIENIEDGELYFIKGIYGTGGKNVECTTGKTLKNYELTSNKIIQEGITDIKLIDGKKFVIRVYIVIYNKKIYLSKYSWCMVHGKPYERSASYDVQIKHSGYANRNSPIKMIPLHETEFADSIYDIKDAISNVKEIFTPIVEQSSKYEYSIIGPDIIICSDGTIKFIEFNSYPNMVHTNYINKNVNEKMILDFYYLVLADKQNESLLLVNG